MVIETLDIVVFKEVTLSSKLGNIKIWKSTMKSIIIKEDPWNLVDDLIAHIESSTGSKEKTNYTLDERSSQYPMIDLEKIRNKKQRAKSIIELSIEVNMRVHIENKNDPRVEWKNLLVFF
jgi:hypothetical protein